MSAPEEETPRCDVRLVTRKVGSGQVFMVRKLFINDREYIVPGNANVRIDAVPHGISRIRLTLFPTSIAFESEPEV